MDDDAVEAGSPSGIHSCASFATGVTSAAHDLASAFHAGDASAVDAVAAIVIAAVRSFLPGLEPAAIVVIPGHGAGSRNRPVIELVDRVAPALGWPAATPGALERIADGPEGRSAHDRHPAREASTLRWRAELLPVEGPVVLLDDVVRTGATMDAAVLAAPSALAARLVPLAVFRALSDR